MAIDAELLISPELDQAGLVKVMARIDRAMKTSAKKAGMEFQKQVAAGIRKGIIEGSAGGVHVPVTTGGMPAPTPVPGRPRRPSETPQAEIHGPMMGRAESPAAFRARLRREAKEEERIVQERADFWTLGSVARRTKSSIKGANIFGVGAAGLGLAALLGPTAITGGAGLWGMMRSFTIRDDIQKSIDDLLKNSTAQSRVNLSRTTGIDLGSIIALERQGVAAGMKEGELSGLASGVMKGVLTDDPFFAKYKGMGSKQAISTAFATLANLDENQRNLRLVQMGADPTNTGEFFRRLKSRGTGKGGEVTLDDVLKQQQEDTERAKREAEDAKNVERMRMQLAEVTANNTSELTRALGQGSTFKTYIDNVNAQHELLMSGLKNFGAASNIANSLEKLIQTLDGEVLKSAGVLLPELTKLVGGLNDIIAGAREWDQLLRVENAETAIPKIINKGAAAFGYSGDFIQDLKSYLDQWDAQYKAMAQHATPTGPITHSTGYGREMGLE